jgi:predicted amidohydrolase
MPDQLRISLVQTALVWEDPTANKSQLMEQVLPLKGHTDVVVLPEMFTTGFTMNAVTYAEPPGGDTSRWMSQLSRELGAAIAGSIITQDNGSYYNRMYFVMPDGREQHYDKRHLFRMAGEDAVFTPGDERVVVDYLGWRILLQVCYDLRFPVWSRGRNDYDLILYVANWPSPRRLAWQVLSRARAIENLCYVAAVNRVGIDGKGISYAGDSVVVAPKGDILLAFEEEAVAVKTCVINKSALVEYREKFPAHLDADDFKIL